LLSWFHLDGLAMGELIDVGTSGMAPAALVPMGIAAAVVIYGFFSSGTKNDDDDSSPGGGLMQPVA
jgi:hypothetical protein